VRRSLALNGKRLKMKADIISGIVFFLMGCYIFFKGTLIPEAELQRGPGPGFFPMFIGILLGVLGLLLAVLCYTTRSKLLVTQPAKESEVSELFSGTNQESKIKNVVMIIFSLVVYILVLPYLGFTLTSTLFGGFYLFVFFQKNIIRSLFTSLLIAVTGYVLFKIALSVSLPTFLNKGWF